MDLFYKRCATFASESSDFFINDNFDKRTTGRMGRHTYEHSLLFIRNREITKNHNDIWVGDLAPTILKMMALPIPADMDGMAVV